MKIICALLCSLCLMVSSGYAQFGKIFDRQGTKITNAGKNIKNVPKNTGKRVTTNASNKINSSIDRKVDRAVDKVLNPRIQRGSGKNTIVVKNADGSKTERQMTRKERRAAKKQDRQDKKQAKADAKYELKYGVSPAEERKKEEAELKAALEEKIKQKKKAEYEQRIAKTSGSSRFLLIKKTDGRRPDSLWVDGYVDRTRTAVKVRSIYNRDSLIHWCINNRATESIDERTELPAKLEIGGDDAFKNFRYEREYKMQIRDSVICAHYLGSNELFDIEIWADESEKVRHFEQFVINKDMNIPLLRAVMYLGKMNVLIKEAVITEKSTGNILHFKLSSRSSVAPSSSHFKTDEMEMDWDKLMGDLNLDDINLDDLDLDLDEINDADMQELDQLLKEIEELDLDLNLEDVPAETPAEVPADTKPNN